MCPGWAAPTAAARVGRASGGSGAFRCRARSVRLQAKKLALQSMVTCSRQEPSCRGRAERKAKGDWLPLELSKTSGACTAASRQRTVCSSALLEKLTASSTVTEDPPLSLDLTPSSISCSPNALGSFKAQNVATKEIGTCLQHPQGVLSALKFETLSQAPADTFSAVHRD